MTPVAAASSCSAVPWLRDRPFSWFPVVTPLSLPSTQDNETRQTLSYHVAVKQKLPPNPGVNGPGDTSVWAPDGDGRRAVGPKVPRGAGSLGPLGTSDCLKNEG